MRAAVKTGPDALLAYSRDLLCICSATGRLEQVGEASARLTGWAPEELAGRSLKELIHQADGFRLAAALQQVREQGYAEEVPLRFARKRGGWAALRWSLAADETRTQVYAVARAMRRERERTQRSRARAVLREAMAERDRLHADLHDGLLQSLTGISLKLATALRYLPHDPETARRQVERAASVLREEQLELRFLIQDMKEGWSDAQTGLAVDLAERLADFARRLNAVWAIRLSSRVIGDAELPTELRPAVLRVVQEAVTNAARHGGASAADVVIQLEQERVVVRITDNGQGFNFSGRFDDDALRTEKKGPAVLKNRVWALGGTVSITSEPGATSLEATIPFGGTP